MWSDRPDLTYELRGVIAIMPSQRSILVKETANRLCVNDRTTGETRQDLLLAKNQGVGVIHELSLPP
jgi:hypothetical protein